MQHAYNYAGSGPVAEAAENGLRNELSGRMLLKLPNKRHAAASLLADEPGGSPKRGVPVPVLLSPIQNMPCREAKTNRFRFSGSFHRPVPKCAAGAFRCDSQPRHDSGFEDAPFRRVGIKP